MAEQTFVNDLKMNAQTYYGSDLRIRVEIIKMWRIKNEESLQFIVIDKFLNPITPMTPRMWLDFQDFTKILKNRDDTFLVDVIGEIHNVQTHTLTEYLDGSTQWRIQFDLRDLNGVLISCVLYDDYSTQFDYLWDSNPTGCNVLALQFARVIAIEGKPLLIANHFRLTNLIMDETTLVLQHFKKALALNERKNKQDHKINRS